MEDLQKVFEKLKKLQLKIKRCEDILAEPSKDVYTIKDIRRLGGARRSLNDYRAKMEKIILNN